MKIIKFDNCYYLILKQVQAACQAQFRGFSGANLPRFGSFYVFQRLFQLEIATSAAKTGLLASRNSNYRQIDIPQ